MCKSWFSFSSSGSESLEDSAVAPSLSRKVGFELGWWLPRCQGRKGGNCTTCLICSGLGIYSEFVPGFIMLQIEILSENILVEILGSWTKFYNMFLHEALSAEILSPWSLRSKMIRGKMLLLIPLTLQTLFNKTLYRHICCSLNTFKLCLFLNYGDF